MAFSIFSRAQPLTPGTPTPTLSVTTDDGQTIHLSDLYAKGPVLIYFYPKADTPGCTKQACNLRDEFAALEQAGLTVLGVSGDSVQAQSKFRDKYNLPFRLVADQNLELAKAYGVPAVGPIVSRQSFLIVNGKIQWHDAKAKPATQAADALAALKAIQSAD
jgi:peroxiredoxin Q/BCP